ncbi:DUF3298 and DUF4163 domain-containing protein [Winogradskyella alexanderae]|uniref:DUF3298 and DUF4163 domain-containing protein n=1 Tax=Winogradskyella alexanderae TaxID=2877123 RepID=A0ABS7XN38_9FLAO|nr:DUF3298 and DUF4163 domain-containing protein [Winogradskyella alexanderae]MCA0131425.1 DUF3298 and DUF4163 domain-containing protein [Winogradskyella alexanderae]
MKILFTIGILTMFLIGCENEPKPVVFKTIEIDSKYEAEIQVTLDKAQGNSQLTRAINANIENSIVNTINTNEKDSTLNDILESFNKEYLKFKSEFPDESDPIWELYVETEKTYQSEAVISIAISTYEFMGGAHGNDQITLLNINAQSGEVIKNENLVSDTLALKELAKEYFIKALETDSNDTSLEDYFYGDSFQLPKNMGLGEEGLIMLYNTYEIASYAQGYTEFVIPYEAITSLLKFN